jgi:hypothetical protein
VLNGYGRTTYNGLPVVYKELNLRPPGNLCKEVESDGYGSPGWRPQALKVPGATRNRAPVCAP